MVLPQGEIPEGTQADLLGRFLLLVAKGEQLVEDARKIAQEMEEARKVLERLLPRADDPRFKRTFFR